ncbi:MAG: hypothetical protein AAGJ10_13850 [Bacteroidota bacterium]
MYYEDSLLVRAGLRYMEAYKLTGGISIPTAIKLAHTRRYAGLLGEAALLQSDRSHWARQALQIFQDAKVMASEIGDTTAFRRVVEEENKFVERTIAERVVIGEKPITESIPKTIGVIAIVLGFIAAAGRAAVAGRRRGSPQKDVSPKIGLDPRRVHEVMVDCERAIWLELDREKPVNPSPLHQIDE